MDSRRVTVLGSTGSIGRNTLEVFRHFSSNRPVKVVALTGNSNIGLLARQAVEFNAEIAVTASPHHFEELKSALQGTGVEAAAGPDALIEAAGRPADWVMAGIIGIAGLPPTLAAAATGATIALANKECLVCAGELFLAQCARSGSTVLPVDSEHNAIFQVFEADQRSAIERIILTASGGPFRQWPRERMSDVTPKQAASHPTYSMGLKISIDSATLFNKGLEMIEARHLFQMRPDQVEVIIHPQSIVHSMVGYADGSILAQMGSPDMRTAIAYAFCWPERGSAPVDRLDFAQIAQLDFEPPDEIRFPALRLAREAMMADGTAPTVFNGAREAALDAYLAGQIGFLDIAEHVEAAMSAHVPGPAPQSLEHVLEIDRSARAQVKQAMKENG